VAARLYLLTKHPAYLTQAKNEWAWIAASGMIHAVPGGDLVLDHITCETNGKDKSCAPGGRQFWTSTEATEGSALAGLNANVTRHAANC
jgi:hypothetical protein